MKTYLKRIIVACIAACLAVCLSIFTAACGATDTFTVTVKDASGANVSGVIVQVCAQDGNQLCLNPVSDANGVATADLTNCEGATIYSIHVLTPGYVLVSSDANVPVEEDGGIIVVASDVGYKVTITVEAPGSTAVIDEQNVIANTSFEVEPAISIAGFYELNSSTPFSVSGEGFDLSGNHNGVLMYLDSESSFNVSISSYAATFQCYIRFISVSASNETMAIAVSSFDSAVINVSAGKSVHFYNPQVVNNHEGNIAEVSGTNFKASIGANNVTEKFIVGLGRNFSVTTADGAEGLIILNFSSPANSVTVTELNADTPFSVVLIENSNGNLSWATNNRTFYVNFAVQEEGDYKFTVTSSYANDAILITQTGSISTSHYPDEINKSEQRGVTYFASYHLRAGTTYSAFVISDTSYPSSEYSEGGTISYTAKVERV